jgi:hypothetical protein
LREQRSGLPEWLLQVQERAHHPILEQRFQTATAFLQALEQKRAHVEGDEFGEAHTVPFLRVELTPPPLELIGKLSGKGGEELAAEKKELDSLGSTELKETVRGPMLKSPTGPALKSPTGPALKSPTGPALKSPTGPALKSPTGPALKSPTGPALKSPTGPAVQGTASTTAAPYLLVKKSDRQAPAAQQQQEIALSADDLTIPEVARQESPPNPVTPERDEVLELSVSLEEESFTVPVTRVPPEVLQSRVVPLPSQRTIQDARPRPLAEKERSSRHPIVTLLFYLLTLAVLALFVYEIVVVNAK